MPQSCRDSTYELGHSPSSSKELAPRPSGAINRSFDSSSHSAFQSPSTRTKTPKRTKSVLFSQDKTSNLGNRPGSNTSRQPLLQPGQRNHHTPEIRAHSYPRELPPAVTPGSYPREDSSGKSVQRDAGRGPSGHGKDNEGPLNPLLSSSADPPAPIIHQGKSFLQRQLEPYQIDVHQHFQQASSSSDGSHLSLGSSGVRSTLGRSISRSTLGSNPSR
jgi:hypothetical protein